MIKELFPYFPIFPFFKEIKLLKETHKDSLRILKKLLKKSVKQA